MSKHTTNYHHAFIAVAEDCPASSGQVPPERGGQKTAAGLQYEIIQQNPYRYTSDEVFFMVYAHRKDLTAAELPAAKALLTHPTLPAVGQHPLPSNS
jgi:hypothetical protein